MLWFEWNKINNAVLCIYLQALDSFVVGILSHSADRVLLCLELKENLKLMV
jgi:hypothetical protein